jgi:ABC-type branched-subunit amino acid transport system ATPase component
MGPNGAGKTTFFNAISGVTPLTSGQLAIVDIMPSILQHMHIVAPPAVAREMEGRSFLR